MKSREAKSKGEKERYKHLNTEFQRIARRDKKAFLSDQCKEIEENNRMGKTRDLFKKSRDTKGTFHAKMGLIKDRNGMDLTEAEDIKKRGQEYTEELYKKNLMDSVGEGEGGKMWENDIETCKVSCMKRVASPGSMHDTGCLGLVHWDDPEGWYGEGGGFRMGNTCIPVAD